MRNVGAMLFAAVSVAGASAADAQRPAAPPARPPAPPAVDRRPPLDRTRSVFLDDQSGLPGALTPIRATLRDAHLWTIQDRRDRADLVLTLKPAGRPAARSGATRVYELSVQPAVRPGPTPLWRTDAPTPAALAKRLKADLAPSVCFVLWCR